MKKRIIAFLLLLMVALTPAAWADGAVTVAAGTNTNTWALTNISYPYSLCEILVTKDELGGNGILSSIAFYKVGNSTTTITRHLRVRINRAAATPYSSNSDWRHSVDDSDNLYFDGYITFHAGWNRLEFSRPLVINDNNSDGIAVLVEDYTGSGMMSNLSINCESGATASTYRCLSMSHSINPQYGTSGDYDSFYGDLANRPTMRFGIRSISEVEVSDYAHTTTSASPYSTIHGYHYDQHLYTAAELEGPQSIQSIGLKRSTDGSTVTEHIAVYMGETSRSNLHYSSMPLDSLKMVFSGTVTHEPGEWYYIPLNQTFNYSGGRSLVVAFVDTLWHAQNGFSHECDYNCDYTARTYTSTTTRPDYNSSSVGSSSSTRCKIRFVSSRNQTRLGTLSNNYESNDSWIFPEANYAYTQQLYTKELFQGPARFDNISFYNNSPYFSATRNCTIYLGNTSKTYFANQHDWVPSSQLQQVYSGPVYIQPGWNTIYFTTPFYYDGNSTLVIACDDNTGSFTPNGIAYKGFKPSNQTRLLAFNNFDYTGSSQINPSPSSPPTADEENSVVPCFVLGSDGTFVSLGPALPNNDNSSTSTPFSASSRYSQVQQIFTAEELGGENIFSHLSFSRTTTSSTAARQVDIYLAETDKQTFSSNSDFIPYANFRRVYSGSCPCNSEWCTVVFDSLFHYSGKHNLAVMFYDHTGSTASLTFRSLPAMTGSVIARQSSSAINLASASSSGSRSQYRTDFRFGTANGRNVFIGSHVINNSNGDIPLDKTSSRYSYSEVVYHQNEIGGAMRINHISFYQTMGDSSARHIALFLGETSRTYPVNTSFFPQSSLTRVFSGSVVLKPGWNTIVLTTPFYYSGTASLIVALKDSTGSVSNHTFANFCIPSQTSNLLYRFSNYQYSTSSSMFNNLSSLSPINSYLRPVIRLGNGAPAHYYHIGTAIQPYYTGHVVGGGDVREGDIVTLYANTNYEIGEWELTYPDTVITISADTVRFVAKRDVFCRANTTTCHRPQIDYIGRYDDMLIVRFTGYYTGELYYKEHGAAQWADTLTFSQTMSVWIQNLLDTTLYDFQLRSNCSSLGNSSWVTGSAWTTPASCGTPYFLLSNNITTSSAQLSWYADDASTFQLSYRPASSSQWGNPVTVNSHSYTLTGLSPQTTYYFRVRSVCSPRTSSDWSTSESFTTTAPDCPVPTSLTASAAPSSITLSWNGSASNYQVAYKLHSSSSWITAGTTANTTYTINSLSESTQYDYRVRGYCSSTNTSTWVSGTISTSPTPCAAPTDLSATATAASITPSWNGSASNYQVAYKLHSASSWTTAGTTANTTYTVTGLTDSTQYDYRVRGYCSSTNTSSWVTGTIFTAPVSCSAPADLTVSAVTCSTAVASWNGSASSYQVSYRSSSTSTWSAPVTVSSNTYTLTGLDATTSYFVRVRAVCSPRSHSGWTATVFTTVEPPCAEPTELTAVATANSVSLSWTGEASRYQYAYKLAADTLWSAPAMAYSSNVMIPSLTDSTQYDYRVRGYCSATSQSQWVEGSVITLSAPCDPPAGLSISAACSTAVATWRGSASEYQVCHKPTAAESWSEPVSLGSTTFSLDSLNPATSYDIRVRAVCSERSHSPWTQATFVTASPEPCNQPTNLVATPAESSARIAWTPGTAIAESWEVEYGTIAQGYANRVTTLLPECTLSDLMPNEMYMVRVRENCGGENYSEWTADAFTPHVGIADLHNQAQVTLQPNPAHDVATIAIEGMTGEVEIDLVDVTGVVLLHQQAVCHGDCTHTLLIDQLPAGIYFVQLNQGGVRIVRKLIVR